MELTHNEVRKLLDHLIILRRDGRISPRKPTNGIYQLP
jgi:hypothetical protein